MDPKRPLPLHVAVLATLAAGLSAIINNVAALALLMPLDVEAAEKAKRAAGQSLMPLSFATILGGMITLIGTPPNIVISEYRQDALGAPFDMFDFAPVGLTVAIAGIAFVSLVGWRLLPTRTQLAGHQVDLNKGRYVAELRIGDEAADGDLMVQDLYPQAENAGINILGLIRRGRRRPGLARREVLLPGDFLVVEGEPKSIESFMGQVRLDFAGSEKHEGGVTSTGLALVEAIVPDGARIQNRTARALGLLQRHSVTLLGVARSGKRFRDRVRLLPIRSGDVLLLLGDPERVAAATEWLGVLPIEGRSTEVIQRGKAGISVAIGLYGARPCLPASSKPPSGSSMSSTTISRAG
ncbi:SLC13 family permease [Silicimonas algicola]|uniref:SLC13 family permease n=1 Tax=Silicimonas algicola TaxID=1826607 RepID=UPI001F49A984|nr:SLC13 family permease [Silicimonas algicola]